MFGTNKIEGRKLFNAEAKGRILVTTIFETLQGEGPYQGQPAIFVRFAKCNLQCSFCDTYFDSGDWWKTKDLAAEVYMRASRLYRGDETKIGVVITGGEPLLQTEIVEFLHCLKAWRFAFLQIETNGILALPSYMGATGPVNVMQTGVTIICSPKAGDQAGRTHYIMPHPSVLEHAAALKFVLSHQENANQCYHRVPEWAMRWRDEYRRPIYVSPMNIYNRLPARVNDLLRNPNAEDARRRADAEIVTFWENGLLDMAANQRNHEYAARYALANGMRLTLQMHLYASLA